MSHTKGPWLLSSYYSDCLTITDKSGYEIVNVNGCAILQGYAEKLGVNHWSDSPYASYELSEAEQQENARRIVACVNACAGIPTELLEDTKCWAESGIETATSLRKQRDDLLAALEHAEYTLQGFSTDVWSSELLRDVRATIASVKE